MTDDIAERPTGPPRRSALLLEPLGLLEPLRLALGSRRLPVSYFVLERARRI